MTERTNASESAFARLLTLAGFALVLGLTLFWPSATRIQAWPWAAYLSAFWLLPITVALFRLAAAHSGARFGGWLDAGYLLLGIAAAVATLLSPLRDTLLPNLLPFFGACALPYALLPLFEDWQIQRTALLISLFSAVVAVFSLLMWLHPWNWSGWPGSRNEFPFGHGNLTGSFGFASTSLALVFAARSKGVVRVAALATAVLCLGMLVSSSSRGAILAMAVMLVTAAGIALLRRGRRILFVVLSIAIAGAAVASNPRLRDLVRHGRWSTDASESNQQRVAMIRGGIDLGAARTVTGWGPGAVPHVFPRVRAELPGKADNFLQLHNTPVQLWATLGLLGIFSGLVIVAALAHLAFGRVWMGEQIWLAGALIGIGILLLFDHPLPTPAFALLASVHVVAWARPGTERLRGEQRDRSRETGAGVRFSAVAVIVFTIATVLPAVARDIAARRVYAGSLLSAERGDFEAYAMGLKKAHELRPTDPFYAHQLAAHLATGHPQLARGAIEPASAIPLLLDSLKNNPDLEYAHYNLGWLVLSTDASTAARHFEAALRLAPERGGVYFGLGLARREKGDIPGAVRAFAAELLNDPAFAWSEEWFFGPLAELRSSVMQAALEAPLPKSDQATRLRAAWSRIAEPAPVGRTYLRIRTGYGVLLGHPDGPPPVDVNQQTEIRLPEDLSSAVPAKGWLDGRFLLGYLDGNAR